MNISNPKTIECFAKNLLIGRRKTGELGIKPEDIKCDLNRSKTL